MPKLTPYAATLVTVLLGADIASARSVTLRVLDQDSLEHTRATIYVVGTVTVRSGGVANLVAGREYVFDVGCSAWSSRAGERSINRAYLNRRLSATVPEAGELVFVWERAVWDPIDLLDQEGVRHGGGGLYVGSAWDALPGDSLRVPVTDHAATRGPYAAGYPVRVTPSSWEEELGDQWMAWTHLSRTERRSVSLDSEGLFEWDRAIGTLRVLDDTRRSVDGVSVYSTNALSATSNRDVRIPVTTDDDVTGASAEGYDWYGWLEGSLYQVFDAEVSLDGFVSPATFVVDGREYEAVVQTEIEVAFDLKPGTCPNRVNVASSGVLPAALVGTMELDVTSVDLASLRLAGVAPLRAELDDVATPHEPYTGRSGPLDCTEAGPDGMLDAALKFDTEELVAAVERLLGRSLAHGETVTLPLSGTLTEDHDATPIVADEVMTVLRRGRR